ncbi:MAG: polyprenol phosphomannose-dependent alpha 1,6 mannosyltransferase MptB, partial [Patescibacteria group bacterium]
HDNSTALLIVVLLSLLFICYFCTYYFTDWIKVNIKTIFFFALVFNMTFLFIPFLTSNDLFSYIFQSRVFSHFGKNPYLITYDSFPNDQFYESIKTIWSSNTLRTGPLFLFIGAFINLLGQNSLTLTILLFKILLVGANILNVFLIFKISKSTKATFLYALNPLVIFELAGNAHNESLLILFLLISLLFLLKQPILSFSTLIASTLVKYSTFMLLPLYLVFIKRKGWKILCIALSLGTLILVTFYLPFWSGLHIFDGLIAFYNGKYISPSLGILIGQKIFGSYELSFKINTLVFLVVITTIIIKSFFSKLTFKQFVFYSFLIYWIYLSTKLSLVLTWYLTPLVALASLCTSWKKREKYAMSGLIFIGFYCLLLFYFVR